MFACFLRSHLVQELGTTAKDLTNQLRDLVRDGLLKRTEFDEKPLRVEYSMTELCRDLLPILDSVKTWCADNEDTIVAARQHYDASDTKEEQAE